ncbi:hypothetical protein HYH02_003454 [Chlamydomonas schloesseri]|uniref:GB1/RHD3-type G domain-containing protein n=1 Tax=Chlamydomonas schloesseri TaxID=2026947 RepID=A0A836BA06_9CHLO|nr:hypothetical protein HYH02_003454 [Chlamydomonas schloesseri]|eukprot:KAG2451674.1 hypothetical protein HYH02_003454 [Chlamydomonas schloesseri]
MVHATGGVRKLPSRVAALACVVGVWACIAQRGYGYVAEPVALVLPVDSRSQLAVQPEGLELLRSIRGPVAPVVVIGPYRSGKSFTLNQLLGVPCDKGFGVGHTRETETKGIWLWGTPQPRQQEQQQQQQAGEAAAAAADATAVAAAGAGADENSMIVYVDTEGFESTGKSNSYDDRIFALSALLSSLLIYNLPETIRESDVAKLSFAVELAQGFYEHDLGTAAAAAAGGSGSKDGDITGGGGGAAQVQEPGGGGGGGGGGNSVEPGSMLWLIQRDFLQGQTADQLVRAVLQPVPNPQHDAGLDALNQVRSSLSALARNSTGFSLRQPHLDRTRLCELADVDLDPVYVAQREQLKATVQALARPKVVAGRALSGAELAGLVSKMVAALNEQEIPTGASLLAAFNRDVLARCAANYTAALAALGPLPVDDAQLGAVELSARSAALEMLQSLQIGRQRAADTRAELVKELDRALQVRRTENLAASNAQCSELENKCEALLDEMQTMRLPSLHKFESAHRRCVAGFKERCHGPAKQQQMERLDRAWARASKAFGKDYNDRLFTGLLVASLAAACVFRFLLRVQLLEGGAWAAFLFLEVYPKVHPASSMYDTKGWALTVRLWELVVMVLFGFTGAGFVWLGLGVAAVVARAAYSLRRRRRVGGGGGGGGGGSWSGGGSGEGRGGGGGGSSGGLWWGSSTRRKQTSVRDLDV